MMFLFKHCSVTTTISSFQFRLQWRKSQDKREGTKESQRGPNSCRQTTIQGWANPQTRRLHNKVEENLPEREVPVVCAE